MAAFLLSPAASYCHRRHAPGRRRDAAQSLSPPRRPPPAGAAAVRRPARRATRRTRGSRTRRRPAARRTTTGARRRSAVRCRGRAARPGARRCRGPGPRSASSTKPPYDLAAERRTDPRAGDGAVERSATSAESPVASTRTQPVTVTCRPGERVRRRAGAAVRRWPASRGRRGGRSGGGLERHDDVDARRPLPRAVADDDGLVGEVRAARRDQPPLVAPGRPPGRGASTSATAAGAAASLRSTTALSRWRSSSRPNCHSPSHQAAYASSTTTRKNTIHRRLTRKREGPHPTRLAGGGNGRTRRVANPAAPRLAG